MSRNDPYRTVFISYRRKYSEFIARAIFQDLRAHDYDVFMDVESINQGQFGPVILNQIAARAHFLLILTPGTLDRCTDPNDWLRREIEFALELRRNVVPVMVNGFRFEDAIPHLTGKLADLPRYNSVPIYHEYFEEGMARLRERFLVLPEGEIQPAPPEDDTVVQRKMEQAAEQPAPTDAELQAEEYFRQGVQFYEEGHIDKALAAWNITIRLNPNFDEAYNNRGVIRQGRGDTTGALEDFDHALALNPDNEIAYINRGETLFAQAQYEEALEDFRTANDLLPGDASILAGLAVTQHALGNTPEAMRLWHILQQLDARYNDADALEELLDWAPPLVERARVLIEELQHADGS